MIMAWSELAGEMNTPCNMSQDPNISRPTKDGPSPMCHAVNAELADDHGLELPGEMRNAMEPELSLSTTVPRN